MTDIYKEFATALFFIAKEGQKLDIYEEKLQIISDLFKENPEYLSLLSSPNISKKERTDLIEKAFGDILDNDLLSFLKLLCEQGHIKGFEACKTDFLNLLTEDRKILKAKVTSAVPLTEDQKKQLVKKLETIKGYKVEAEYKIDKNLLGGLIVETDGKVIDGSIINQMRSIKEVIES